MRADGEEGGVPHENLAAGTRQEVGAVFALGAAAVVQLGIEFVRIRQERAQQEVRRRSGRRFHRQQGGRDAAGDRGLVERLLVRHRNLVGDAAVPVDVVAVRAAVVEHDGTLIHIAVGRGVVLHLQQIVFESFRKKSPFLAS